MLREGRQKRGAANAVGRAVAFHLLMEEVVVESAVVVEDAVPAKPKASLLSKKGMSRNGACGVQTAVLAMG